MTGEHPALERARSPFWLRIERSSPEMNLVLCVAVRDAHGGCFCFLVMWLWVRQRAKTSRGAGCVPSSTRPPAVEGGKAPTEGAPGEVGRTKLFTTTLCGRYLNCSGFAAELDCAERPFGDWSFVVVNGHGLYDSQISLFYPFVEKSYALIGSTNDFCDWGIGRRWFFN